MPMPTRVINSGLQNKGFVKENKNHKVFRYIAEDGTKTSIFTQVSHGPSGRDVHDNIIRKMAKQCQISTDQFKDLVCCPFERKEYEEKLRDSGAL